MDKTLLVRFSNTNVMICIVVKYYRDPISGLIQGSYLQHTQKPSSGLSSECIKARQHQNTNPTQTQANSSSSATRYIIRQII